MKLSAKCKKVWDIITGVIVAIVLLLAILIVGVRVFGINVMTITSPSMTPVIPTGSIVYVKQIDTDDIKEKDIITFKTSTGTVVTHRVEEIIIDGENVVAFRTKGDANPDPDNGLLDPKKVVGKVVGIIPVLGHIALFVQSGWGIATSVLLLVVISVPSLLQDYIFEKAEPKNKKQKRRKKDDRIFNEQQSIKSTNENDTIKGEDNSEEKF